MSSETVSGSGVLDVSAPDAHFKFHQSSTARRLCVFHSAVCLFNQFEYLRDGRSRGSKARCWTVDTFVAFFCDVLLPWVQVLAYQSYYSIVVVVVVQ